MANDWVSQKMLSKFAAQSAIYDNSREFSFGWWFAYFWKEIGVNGRSEADLKAVLALVFADQVPVDIDSKSYGVKRKAGDKVADDFVKLLPEPVDLLTHATKYREMLTKLLNIGFKAMPHIDVSAPAVPVANAMFLDRIEIGQRGVKIPVAIAYRGDTRDFATVIQHSGAKSRVDLGMCNMKQSWHPFSVDVVANKMYARGASGDNCLYSVTSVATSVKIPVGFPLIEDQNIYSLPSLPVDEAEKTLQKWNYAKLRDAQKKLPVILAKVGVGNVGKASGIFLATESFIYAVKVKQALHTQRFVEQNFAMPQDQCKERGVRGIDLKDFLAGVRLRRIHLGPTRMHGVVAFVQEIKYFYNGRWEEVPNIIDFSAYHFNGDQVAGRAAISKIQDQFTDIILGEDESAPNPKPEVNSIEQWNLSSDQFGAYKNNQADKLYFGVVP
ncbi:MAG: hypothetical protein methR_P0018 [Methyloprofundus sp.]|nr:MAG: hypothetical protein methR_P0018 [Methyloprofundus sp.]